MTQVGTPPTLCSIDGCGRPVKARGWCNLHYLKWRKHGDPLVVINERQHTPDCTVEGCTRPYRAKGYCNIHFCRWRKYGDPLGGGPERGAGYVNSEGYRVLWRPGHPNATRKGAILEHRLAMSGLLGRPLLAGETVHHRNGDKLDNRPQNLELYATRHGRGQDVPSLVAWAREVLRRYGDLSFPLSAPEGGSSP